MESGAILIYLAEKSGQLLPLDNKARFKVLEWLMWQMGGVGPMLGQAHHFLYFNYGVSDYAEKRFAKEVERLYGVLNRQLADNEFIAGNYSIADIATWPWISRYEWQDIDLSQYEHVYRWYHDIARRDAVVRGYSVPQKQEIPLP